MPQKSPRQRISLDRNWRFALGHAADASKDFEFARDRSLVKSGEARGAAGVKFDDSGWRVVDVPHDWCIELPVVQKDEREHIEHGSRAIGPDYPQNSIGWYRKTFDIPKSDLGRRISVELEGVFRDSVAWINGHRLGRHPSGHTPVRYDVTDLLNYGGANVLVVRADATNYEGWWYEGAGIYRHVWLHKTAPLHIPPSGTWVRSVVRRDRARLTVRTWIENSSDKGLTATLETAAVDARNRPTGKPAKIDISIGAWGRTEVVQHILIPDPKLWSCDSPNLYWLNSTLRVGRRIVDLQRTRFGIRTIRFDAKRGFSLNGKPLKIKGTCNHHQHAGVGTAIPDSLHEWRLRRLKAMGSNAYRCSHYMVAPEVLDLCDELGLLVMCENRLAGSSPQFLGDFEAMVTRDRNHPCMILWSIGNEEHTIQWSIAGERIGATLRRTAHRLDGTRPVTAAMHDRGLGEGFANVVDVHGWNYIAVGDIEAFHRRRPDQPIIGSEEGSVTCTRGEYADDASRGYVSAYDKRTPKWGSVAQKWWPYVAERPWIAGGFLWTGFDYYGEPIPYKWPCTASHFGLMDLCGFEKDLLHYFKAWWGGEPVLHVFPHWTWPGREGQPVDLWCYTNHEEVELRVNGVSAGRQVVPKNSFVSWTVNYVPGRIEAVGYRAGKPAQRTRIETTGTPARLRLTAEILPPRGDGRRISLVTVSAVDAQGRPAPTDDHAVKFDLHGRGAIIGVGNGDPSSHEPDKGTARRLFNGLAQVIVESAEGAGSLTLAADSPGLVPAKVRLVHSK